MSTELERGDIFFFYRPRVDTMEVRSLEDVQRFFFILHPEPSTRFRRVIIGSKRLPRPDRHERAWAFVAEVAEGPPPLLDELRDTEYETKSGRRRVQPEARPVGEGRYTIVDHEGHSHLAYALAHPQQPGEAQRAMQIEPEASRALRAATRELGIDLDPEDERIHDADLFTDLRIRPGELPTEPLRTGKLD